MSEGMDEKVKKRKFKEDVDEETIDKKEVKKPSMPTYGKYNILNILKENHCLIADEQQFTNAFPRNKRYDLDDIKAFVNKTAQKSQSITEKNNTTSEFKRATELIASIEQRCPFTSRTLELPLSLKTITDVYNYEEEDVDMRMLYQTLTNLSMGFPTMNMDNATNDFLYGIYKEFLEQVNTKQFQEDIQKYQNKFNSSSFTSEEHVDIKHPTDNSDMQFLTKSALTSPSVNPLNVPYSLLHKPKDTF